jgi:hypothetical protein
MGDLLVGFLAIARSWKGDQMKNNGNGRRAPLFLMMLAALVAVPAFADHSFGLGVHHWQTVDDLADEGFEGLEEEGTSGIVSYQYIPEGLFTLEADLEYFADGFGGSTESAFSPQVYLLVGHGLYAGAGVGVIYSDGDSSDPFYAARVGFNFSVIPRLKLDINANYR